MIKKTALLIVTCCLFGLTLHAQNWGPEWLQTKNDSNYVEDLTQELTARLLGSRKYTYYDVADKHFSDEIRYRPNNNFNIGIGANYKFLGLNLAFNMPFFNNDNATYGKTKFLDLQSHIYLRKLVVDFYGQYYKSYYIENPYAVLKNYTFTGTYPLRPDLYNLDLGVSVQYIFNDSRFSYRAAYTQNEYQKKSAGSFLVGGEVFALTIKADSAIIPRDIFNKNFWNYDTFNRSNTISMVVNGGYAYTFVYKKHYFCSLSLSGGLGINHTKLLYPEEEDKQPIKKYGWQINNTFRVSAGYNSRKYYIGLSVEEMIARSQSPIPQTYQKFGTGNFRINLVKRFRVKRNLFKGL